MSDTIYDILWIENILLKITIILRLHRFKTPTEAYLMLILELILIAMEFILFYFSSSDWLPKMLKWECNLLLVGLSLQLWMYSMQTERGWALVANTQNEILCKYDLITSLQLHFQFDYLFIGPFKSVYT